MGVEPLEAQRGGRMLARAEREPHVELDPGASWRDARIFCGCEPQAISERPCRETPTCRFAPLVVVDACDAGRACASASAREETAQRIEVDPRGEQRAQLDRGPQRRLLGRRFEDGIIARVRKRERLGTCELEQSLGPWNVRGRNA